MRKPRPHTPAGMQMLNPPITRAVADWVSQTFDAKIDRNGITWFRVKDGMGGRGDREDWIADVPSENISVHDYHWNGDDFGPDHGTFENAIVQESKRGLEEARRDLIKKTKQVEQLKTTVAMLEKLLKPQTEAESERDLYNAEFGDLRISRRNKFKRR